MIGLAGKPEAEFIGVGALSTRRLPRRVVAASPTAPKTTITVDPYAQSLTDLQNQVQAVIGAGDQYLANGDAAQALQTYQAAGSAGVFSVGPEIDLAGPVLATYGYTGEAWAVYQALVATQDANAARELARHMADLYGQAIIAGRAAVFPDAVGLPPPPSPTGNVGAPSSFP